MHFDARGRMGQGGAFDLDRTVKELAKKVGWQG